MNATEIRAWIDAQPEERFGNFRYYLSMFLGKMHNERKYGSPGGVRLVRIELRAYLMGALVATGCNPDPDKLSDAIDQLEREA